MVPAATNSVLGVRLVRRGPGLGYQKLNKRKIMLKELFGLYFYRLMLEMEVV